MGPGRAIEGLSLLSFLRTYVTPTDRGDDGEWLSLAYFIYGNNPSCANAQDSAHDKTFRIKIGISAAGGIALTNEWKIVARWRNVVRSGISTGGSAA